MVASAIEFAWAGALEAEDRLLVIADAEYRPDGPVMSLLRVAGGEAAACPGAAVEFLGDSLDDVPLLLVGILPFVDQDVIGFLIELVAYPVAHPRRREQHGGFADEIVEIDRPAGAFGLDIMPRISLARGQAGRDQIGELCASPQFGELREMIEQRTGMRLAIRIDLEQAAADFAESLVRGAPDKTDPIEIARPRIVVERKPGIDRVDEALPRRLAPA